MRKTIYFIFALAAVFITFDAAAQKRSGAVQLSQEQLPQLPIDTIGTEDPETKIILYSNNTWSYYRPEIAHKHGDIYDDHWETSQVFAYRDTPYSELPSIVELELISSLGEYHYPVKGIVRSRYGPRGRRNHNGVDIPLTLGEPIYATFEGKVRYAQYNTGGFGNLVIIRHPNGLETWHGHMTRTNVAVNDYVKAGQVIGFAGNTGRSKGVHLHFEMRYKDQTFDPEFIIDFSTGQIKYQTFALEKSFFNIHSHASDQLEELDDDGNIIMMANEDDFSSEDLLEHITKTNTAKSAAAVSQSNAVYHTVKSGDILGRIAAKYGVSIDQICRLNGIKRTATLRIGQKLRVK